MGPRQYLEDPKYWIYPDGRIWSDKSKKFLTQSWGGFKNKYRMYVIAINGKQKTLYVHRLLMQYFGPSAPFPNAEVNHIDGNTANNKLENLEWVSSSENTRHGVRTGLFSRVKLTTEQVREIKRTLRDEPAYYGQVSDIAKKYGVKYGVISSIKFNKNWQYIEID